MVIDKSLHLSLTKEDIDYLLNSKEIAKWNKYFKVMSNVIKIVIGAGGGIIGLLAYLQLVAPVVLSLGGISFGAIFALDLLGDVSSKNKKKKCDDVLERVKLIAQHHCPERLIDGATFKVVRSNNVVSNLENYSFEHQMIHPTGEKTVAKVDRDDLQIGTISTQFIISDKNGDIGAIEEKQINDLERMPTKDGSSESVVSRFIYNWVPSNEIRTPYEDADNVDKSNEKGKLKARKPNNEK